MHGAPPPGPALPASRVYYRPIADEERVFEAAWKQSLPLLLKGPTGCGKSRFVEAMAHKLNRPLITVACNEETSAPDLLGRFLVKGSDTVWQDGPVTRAVREGAILYLDEVAEAREDVLVVLHPLSDHRRALFLDRTGEALRALDGFMLVASYNPGYRQALKELKPSTRQRFVTLPFGWPPPEVEAEIVARECGVEAAVAKRLVGLAVKIRALQEVTLAETVSTRLLVNAARLMASGMLPRRACAVGIVQAMTDDPATALALQDLADLAF